MPDVLTMISWLSLTLGFLIFALYAPRWSHRLAKNCEFKLAWLCRSILGSVMIAGGLYGLGLIADIGLYVASAMVTVVLLGPYAAAAPRLIDRYREF